MNQGVAPKEQPRRSRSLTQQLVESLTERVRGRELKPGDKLPTESEIIAAYGVSRTVVREAMSRLQAAGLVETHHGIGTFVLEARAAGNFRIEPSELSTLQDVLAVLEMRTGLETEAAALAAVRRGEPSLAAMRDALDAMNRGIEQSGETVGPDFQFHLQIAQASGNRFFTDLMNYLGPMIIPRTRLNTARLAKLDRPEYLKRVNREHEDIYEAIARKDPEAARAAMRTHLSNSRERLRRAHDEGLHDKLRPVKE